MAQWLKSTSLDPDHPSSNPRRTNAFSPPCKPPHLAAGKEDGQLPAVKPGVAAMADEPLAVNGIKGTTAKVRDTQEAH